MTRTYQATGIILKGMPLGEADRLVTILTSELGLIRAVAPGARKHQSKLRGRSELFVVNHLVIVKGRSLDKITQAETITSYPGLSRDLGRLAASQYLAELVLCLALSDQPQAELYELLNEHLRRLENLPTEPPLAAHVAQAVFHLLAIAGIAPQVHACCLTQVPLTANLHDPHWQIGFSFDAGGTLSLAAQGARLKTEMPSPPLSRVQARLGAVELTLLQHLGARSLPPFPPILPQDVLPPSLESCWLRVERLLRDYAQYQLGRSFRSATLLDNLSPLDF
jgi:DNA repair protein RecO (recombination protein O)